MFGEGINHLQLLVNELVDPVGAGHGLDDPADNDAVHNAPREHDKGHADDFDLSDCGDVTKANGREDGEDKVHRGQPLHERRGVQKQRSRRINPPAPHPRLVRVLLHRSGKVPEASEEVHSPHEPTNEARNTDSAVALHGLPHLITLHEGENLGEAHKPHKRCQAWDVLELTNPCNLVDNSASRVQIEDGRDEKFDNLHRKARKEVYPEEP
mmetsp:Transcript_88015/g.244306  ORF Transcript_88015/g.244306 Transcript_88015/m.244306 type:complete len:211 (-) Transcript_88015:586-1218(-)